MTETERPKHCTDEWQRLSREVESLRAERDALQSQLSMFRGAFEILSSHFEDVVVSMVDRDLRWVAVNGGGMHSFGLPATQLIGKTPAEVLAPSTAAETTSRTQRALNGEIVRAEYVGRGQYRTFNICNYPLYHTDGQIIGAIAITHETTQEKHASQLLETSEARYRSIIEDQSELVCRFDRDGWLTFYNRSFAEFFEIAADTTLIASLLSLTSDEETFRPLTADLDRLTPEQPVSRSLCQIRIADNMYYVRWTTRAIFNNEGQVVEYQSVGTDITEHKRAEINLRKKRALTQTLHEISSVLNSTLDLDQVLKRITENIGRIVPHDIANIMIIEGDDAQIVSESHEARSVSHCRLSLQDTPYLRYMLARECPLIIGNNSQLFETIGETGIRSEFHSYAGTPIWLQGKIIGFINVFSYQPDRFEEKHAQRLQSFANNAATAIRNAQLYARAQEAAAWEERRRIAEDLHDVVSQTLFSINMIADSLPELWDTRPYAVPRKLGRLRQLTHMAFSEMRTLLFELRPETIVDMPLPQLIHQLVEGMSNRSAVNIMKHLNCDEPRTDTLPLDVKITFYRITQEALNNTIRHAEARSVQIFLNMSADGLYLAITDDGRGFDVGVHQSGHMGLQIIQDRAQRIGAHLEILSEPMRGTLINATWKSENVAAS